MFASALAADPEFVSTAIPMEAKFLLNRLSKDEQSEGSSDDESG